MTYLKVSAFKILNFSVLFGFCFLSIANANDNLLDHTKKINFLLSEFHTKNKVALNPKADDTLPLDQRLFTKTARPFTVANHGDPVIKLFS